MEDFIEAVCWALAVTLLVGADPLARLVMHLITGETGQ